MPWLARVLRLPFAVLREGATNIDDLVEATLFVTPNIPFVGSGIDQFAFTRCHGRNLQLSLSACERASSWLGSRKDGSAAVSMIRWEQQDNGDWAGFSGELPVASVSKDQDAEPERWLWNIAGLKRPKGWRKPVGHRTTWLEARRSAEAYWEKWLTASSLRPDIERLALQSIPASERPKARRRKSSKG